MKDRIALHMIKKAAASGRLSSGALITEATAGSTGVSLAMVSAASGYKYVFDTCRNGLCLPYVQFCTCIHMCRCKIFMPDDAAVEKQQELEARGACVERVRPVSISHPQHMVHQARKAASYQKLEGSSQESPPPDALGFFADQFENKDNCEAHIATGEEIWHQSGGCVNAFVCGAGTGGTIAGVSHALKQHSKDVKVMLVDPPGSSLYLKVRSM